VQHLFPFLKSGRVRRSLTRFIKESPLLRYVRLLQPETRLWGREAGTLPSFLVIGAQRSGSTFLHDTLSAHTSARCSPLQKEVHYFDNKFYKPLKWYAKFFASLENRPDAEKNFETSPGYLYHPAVPGRVRQSLPNVKAVAVLRDPVDRAVSQYRWMRQIGLETRDAVEAFRYDARRIDRERTPEHLERFENPLYFDFDHFQRGYLRRSLYHVQLKRWLRQFSTSQIRLVDSGTLFDHPTAVVDELAAFLNVETTGSAHEDAINQNSSRSDIHIPPEAQDIARDHLADVNERVQALIGDEMIIGDALCLNG